MSLGTIRIVVPDVASPGLVVQLFSPYEALSVLSDQVPSSMRRWHRDPPKHWSITEASVPGLVKAFSSAGYKVIVTTASGGPWPRTSRTSSSSSSSSSTSSSAPFSWLGAAFRDAGDETKRERLRTGLLRVWHPDHGHDPAIAQRINTAANDARRRR